MFIGHFAVAFAAKRVAPRTSLGATFVAAQLADLLWPLFLLLGWEQVRIVPQANPFLNFEFVSYPWSHSLAMQLVWGAAFGVLYFAVTRYARGAGVVALLVPSHFLLDLIAHRPDLPLLPGGASRLGLGLWDRPLTTVAVESLMFVAGVAIYLRATVARDRVGRYGIGALIAFLVVGYVASILGPPPPTVTALAWAGMTGWPLTAWPWWADRHRDPRSSVLSR